MQNKRGFQCSKRGKAGNCTPLFQALWLGAVLAFPKAPGLSIVERLRGSAGGDQPSWPTEAGLRASPILAGLVNEANKRNPLVRDGRRLTSLCTTQGYGNQRMAP